MAASTAVAAQRLRSMLVELGLDGEEVLQQRFHVPAWNDEVKNELIIAKKHQRSNPKAAQRLRSMLVELGLDGEEVLQQRFHVPAWNDEVELLPRGKEVKSCG